MEELRETTERELYERYRTEKLLAMGVSQDDSVFREIKCASSSSCPPPSPSASPLPRIVVADCPCLLYSYS